MDLSKEKMRNEILLYLWDTFVPKTWKAFTSFQRSISSKYTQYWERVYGRYIQRHFRYSLQYENRERPYTRMNVDINGFLPFQKASEPNKYGDKPFWWKS